MKPQQISKIDALGLKDRLMEEMKNPKFTYRGFSKKLKEEGIDISQTAIMSYVNNSRKAQEEYIKKDIRVANEFKQLAIDYQKSLKDILKEVNDVKNEARDSKDFGTYNQLIGRLMQGIELLAKITGDVRPKGSVDIKIIYNEINADVESKMKELKEDIERINIIDVDSEVIEEDLEEQTSLINEEEEKGVDNG